MGLASPIEPTNFSVGLINANLMPRPEIIAQLGSACFVTGSDASPLRSRPAAAADQLQHHANMRYVETGTVVNTCYTCVNCDTMSEQNFI